MEITKAFENFEDKLNDLEITIKECETILVSENPVDFVYNHANFLTKSFLISLCGYLETYLKDALEILLLDYGDIITNSKIPQNLVRWSLEKKPKTSTKVSSLLEKKHCTFDNLSIKLKKEDLDTFISGHPYRTEKLLEMFGINLKKCEYFELNKDLVRTIVDKRNNVLHHNDDASDLSNLDVLTQLREIKAYALEIDKIVEKKVINRQQSIVIKSS